MTFYLSWPNVVLDEDVGVAQSLEYELKRHLGIQHHHHRHLRHHDNHDDAQKALVTWL